MKLPRVVVQSMLVMVVSGACALAGDIKHSEGTLPPGSTFGEPRLVQPREVFYSERAGGQRSAQSIIGDLLFDSPTILGPLAQQEGVSCGSCHVQGTNNPKMFIPGHSTRLGNFDTTGPLFNPTTDNHLLDPVTPPSLRGAKFTAPYGHDGRFASLRDFTRNVIVNEFSGPEPDPAVLDALVAYMQDIAPLPNSKLADGSRLTDLASEAVRRGQAVFNRPFPDDPTKTCGTCHIANDLFLDHHQHDIGSGGVFDTPPLINANFNAPYFHDGRFDSYDQVVDYFNGWFHLKLDDEDRRNLIAYLNVIGDGVQPNETVTPTAMLDEVKTFGSALGMLTQQSDWSLVSLAVDSLALELREFQEFYPELKDRLVVTGRIERLNARRALSAMVLALRRLQVAADQQDKDQALPAFQTFEQLSQAAAPPLMAAEAFSYFNPKLAAKRQSEINVMDAASGE